jgi:hypothetical protein
VSRVFGAWKRLGPEQRLAAYAAVGLFLTMFLPWYQRTGTAAGPHGTIQKLSQNLSAFGAFSFVEAAVLLVAAGVLLLLFARAEGRAFHLPGGDGAVVLGAGIWVCLLVFWRQLDKPDAGNNAIVGVQWGIFITFIAGLVLAYAGNRVRAAHRPEPPLPYEREAAPPPPPPPPPPSGTERDRAVTQRLPREPREPRRPRPRADDGELTDQLSLEDPPTLEDPPPPPDLGRRR